MEEAAAVDSMYGIRVFVYGSLKQGYLNHSVLGDSVLVGEAAIEGSYKMIDLGWYPGVVRTADEPARTIKGEVYLVTADTLDALDCLEGHPSYYCREKQRVMFSDGTTKNAWVYLLPMSYNEGNNVVVDSGVWTETEEL